MVSGLLIKSSYFQIHFAIQWFRHFKNLIRQTIVPLSYLTSVAEKIVITLESEEHKIRTMPISVLAPLGSSSTWKRSYPSCRTSHSYTWARWLHIWDSKRRLWKLMSVRKVLCATEMLAWRSLIPAAIPGVSQSSRLLSLILIPLITARNFGRQHMLAGDKRKQLSISDLLQELKSAMSIQTRCP